MTVATVLYSFKILQLSVHDSFLYLHGFLANADVLLFQLEIINLSNLGYFQTNRFFHPSPDVIIMSPSQNLASSYQIQHDLTCFVDAQGVR